MKCLAHPLGGARAWQKKSALPLAQHLHTFLQGAPDRQMLDELSRLRLRFYAEAAAKRDMCLLRVVLRQSRFRVTHLFGCCAI